jgi:hypothetical protein
VNCTYHEAGLDAVAKKWERHPDRSLAKGDDAPFVEVEKGTAF